MNMVANVVNLYLLFIIFIPKHQKKNMENEYGLTSIANVVNLYSLFIISIAKK